jgi:Protein of unknown function (DUF3300)
MTRPSVDKNRAPQMSRVSIAVMLWLFAASALSPWPPTATAQGSAQAAIFRPEELGQLVAPVALYPDALLAQVFMAFYWWPLRRAWVTRAS